MTKKMNGIPGNTLKILLVLLLGIQVVFGQAKIATTSAQFLGIPIGGRALAMGGASVSSMNDISCVYFNPGAFVQAKKTEAMFSNTNWLVDSRLRWIGGMVNFDGANAIAVSITQLDYGDEEVTTELYPNGTGQYWSAQDLSIAISYARSLTDRFSIGGSVKYISQQVWNESASTIAFDAGLLFVTGFHDMRLGMSISNFGGDLSLDGRDLNTKIDIDPSNPGSNKTLVGKLKVDSWPIPIFFRVGLGLDLLNTPEYAVTIAADAIRPNDNVLTLNLGGEVSLFKTVFLRAGYKSLLQQDSEEGLTFGIGARYELDGFAAFELNYANQQFGRFGDLNTISVSIGL
ncbi:MAG: PorV/PorQ family protein [bacterium]